MNRTARIVAAACLCLAASNAMASNIYTFRPNPADLYDLDYSGLYTWGINRSWNTNQTIQSVTLSFDNIANWDNNANVLHIKLFDAASLGVTVTDESSANQQAFNSSGILLKEYINLSDHPVDLSYSFTAAQITTLTQYAADGRFGLGFDPDCHYYNDGVCLTVTTVPEPATVALLVAGAAFLKLRRRRQAC